MIEQITQFGESNSLVGIQTLPPEHAPRLGRPGVILLNAGVVHRVGPHRVTVRLARSIAAIGFPVLRFDLSGIGDSPARTAGSFTHAAVADVRAAMDQLAQSACVDRFVLAGLCSGADNSVRAALADDRVDATLLLDPYTYRTPGFYLRYYGPKLRDPKFVVRFLNRGVKALLGAVRANGGGNALAAALPTAPRYARPQPAREAFAADLKTLLDRGVKIGIVYTGGVSYHYNHAGQFAEGFRKYGIVDRIECLHLPEANHTFTELLAQRLLCEHAREWLSHAFPARPGCRADRDHSKTPLPELEG